MSEQQVERAAELMCDENAEHLAKWPLTDETRFCGWCYWAAEALESVGLLAPEPIQEEWATYDPVPSMWGRTIWPAKDEAEAREKAHAFGYEVRRRRVLNYVSGWEIA